MVVGTRKGQGHIGIHFSKIRISRSGRWGPSILPQAASELHREEIQQLKGLGKAKVSGICLRFGLRSEVLTQSQAQVFGRDIVRTFSFTVSWQCA